MATCVAPQFRLATRPQQRGTSGRSHKVLANFYKLKYQEQVLWQYQVDVTPEVKSKNTMRELIEKVSPQFGVGKGYAYDGMHALFTSKELAIQPLESRVEVHKEGQKTAKLFTIKIRLVSSVDLSMLQGYVRGETKDLPQVALQALDVVLRHQGSIKFFPMRRSFFYPDRKETISPIPRSNVEVLTGHFQSVRASEGGLAINIDLSAVAVRKAINLVEFIATELKTSPDRLLFRDRATLEAVSKEIKGIRIQTTHTTGGHERNHRIFGLAPETPDSYKFTDERGNKISVTEYFRTRYHIQLKRPDLPLVMVEHPRAEGDLSKLPRVPMELCFIAPGQVYKKTMNKDERTAMLKATCLDPPDRYRQIQFGVPVAREDPHMQAFGLDASNDMIDITARALPHPTLVYRDPRQKGREVTAQSDVQGKWNLMNLAFMEPKALKFWGVLVFVDKRQGDATEEFLQRLARQGSGYGMTITPPQVIHRVDRLAEPSKSMPELMQQLAAQIKAPDRPQLLMVILPDEDAGRYGEIKRLSDCIIGVPSQCIQSWKAFDARKFGDQYLANICLKLNSKLGGMNWKIQGNLVCMTKPTIVFGADVHHPGAGDMARPSVASLVGSMDMFASQYYSSITVQDNRVENIQELEGMMRDALVVFYQRNGKRKPDQLFIIRDGVGEGQYEEVARKELQAIQTAAAKLEANYRPRPLARPKP
eukprot:TRINITY_DN3274_c0_g2_i2.p1 TRINITY_DN3274_c0_g2~~TRINITY_DN3274_c0_g2_i2.p1  ORF type:complete len:705 (+),score=308.89 TRINITY_DN3274_c0_g2_i2:108-2222(+)